MWYSCGINYIGNQPVVHANDERLDVGSPHNHARLPEGIYAGILRIGFCGNNTL